MNVRNKIGIWEKVDKFDGDLPSGREQATFCHFPGNVTCMLYNFTRLLKACMIKNNSSPFE